MNAWEPYPCMAPRAWRIPRPVDVVVTTTVQERATPLIDGVRVSETDAYGRPMRDGWTAGGIAVRQPFATHAVVVARVGRPVPNPQTRGPLRLLAAVLLQRSRA